MKECGTIETIRLIAAEAREKSKQWEIEIGYRTSQHMKMRALDRAQALSDFANYIEKIKVEPPTLQFALLPDYAKNALREYMDLESYDDFTEALLEKNPMDETIRLISYLCSDAKLTLEKITADVTNAYR